MLCLPGHTTHALQPLDKSYFKPLKVFYKQAIQQWVFANPRKGLTKGEFGGIFRKAWEKAATISNAVSGFKATGVFPIDRFAIKDHQLAPSQVFATRIQQDIITENEQANATDTLPLGENVIAAALPNIAPQNETIIASLATVLPSPCKTTPGAKKICREKQRAQLVTSPEHLDEIRRKLSLGANKPISKGSKTSNVKQLKTSKIHSTKQNTTESRDDNFCAFCAKSYYSATSTKMSQWIQCVSCELWFHEYCVGAQGKCSFTCGKCIS